MARKILFYTHAFGGGGAEIVFARLAATFAVGGDMVIFAADCSGSEMPLDRPNLRHVLLGANHFSAVRQLRDLLRSEQPDASFSALGAQNLKHLAAATWVRRRHLCVLGYHGFAAAEPRPLSRLCFWASPLVTRFAARTICVSDALLDDLRRRWRASRSRTCRIYNPLPRPSGCGTSATETDGPPLIVGCGRLVPGKRFSDLVAALAQVQPPEARLVILGEGPDRARIERTIATYALEARVELAGHVADPSDWYRRAACVAITSESESFGLTAAEALMYGVPVVATDCGGPREVLGDGQYGRIVPVGDIPALAGALTQTLADPGDERPRRDRASLFEAEAIHRAYAELIDSLGFDRREPPAAKAS